MFRVWYVCQDDWQFPWVACISKKLLLNFMFRELHEETVDLQDHLQSLGGATVNLVMLLLACSSLAT